MVLFNFEFITSCTAVDFKGFIATDTFIDAMGAAGEGTITKSETVQLVTQVKDNQVDASLVLSKYKDENNSNYIDAAQLYVLNSQQAAEEFLIFSETNDENYLNSCGDKLTASFDYLTAIDDARKEYLSEQGFSEGEIIAITTANCKDEEEN